MLEIIEFELERGFDTLTIGEYRGVTHYEIVILTGTAKLHTVPSSPLSSALNLQFQTDKTGSGKGFRINIRQITGTEG